MFVRKNSGRGGGWLDGSGGLIFIYAVMLTILPSSAVLMLLWYIRNALFYWSDFVLLGIFVLLLLVIVVGGLVAWRWARAIEQRGVNQTPTYIFPAPNGATTIQQAATPEVQVTKPTALPAGQAPWAMAQPKQLSAGQQRANGGFTVSRRG